MKSVLTLFLSLVMFVGGLMPHNDVEELSKVPYLIEHFQYHRTVAGGSLSVGQFLRMHYWGPAAASHQLALAEHNKLPFLGEHHFPNLEYIVPVSESLVLMSHVVGQATDHRASADAGYCFAYCEALLQPPRA